jgi:hypothetical protein
MAVNRRAILLKRKETGADVLVDLVLANPLGEEAALFEKAYEINRSQTKRNYVEACLLTTASHEAIALLLEIPAEVISAYARYYYDLEGLDKLSKLDLLSSDDQQETMLKIWSFSQGLDFIAWRLGKPVNINPVNGLQDLFTTCIMKSKEAMFSGNAAEASKEATKWVKLSLDLARLLKAWVSDMDAAKQDIEMALREVVPDFDGFDSLGDDLSKPAKKDSYASNTDEAPAVGVLEPVFEGLPVDAPIIDDLL